MNSLFENERLQSTLNLLSSTLCPEQVDHWPAERLEALRQADVLRWNLPEEFGGLQISAAEMLQGYRLLAASCLVTTFILTQRNGACQRIITSPNDGARQKLLPALARGELFATVGISHLTTSGQHLRTPAVQAEPTSSGYRLHGIVPWATGATQADLLITGGQLEDGQQLLAAVPTDRSGVEVNPPVQMMALNSSQTGSVRLTGVEVCHDEVLHGPVKAVMQQGAGGGTGSLATSVLAAGSTEGMLLQLNKEMQRRPELAEFVHPLAESVEDLVQQIQWATLGTHPQGDAANETIRQLANSLVLRTSQTWLAATKGAGYVSGHRAERAVRESMFFLVWSCPQPVLSGNLRELTCRPAC